MRKRTAFYLEEEMLKNEINKRNAKRVLIQLPEGLKPEGPRLATIVEKAGALPIISADPCYGGCDLAIQEAETLRADLLVHFGHTPITTQLRVPTIYIEAKAEISIKEAVNKALPYIKDWKTLGLATTVQHVDMLSEARELLIETGKSVAIGDTGKLKYAGQVTGCNYSNAKAISKDVEAFLFIGGGKFHAIGLALATTKPVIVAEPYEKRAYAIENEVQTIIKQRWATIYEAKKAENFGVLIGLKSGQEKLDEALQIKEKLERKEKRATLLALREITPEALMQFPTIDTFVNTACPRISLDDASKFLKPVLTLKEASVILGEMSWEKLCKEGWFGNET
ncbi:MAG: diphthamide biosynthesis enzyme Dph2 [Candidatus Bathyarchaeota archaeon]|nr:diphthamide biosynthesis enzyme Dph2 [Candidatus Bathyarchaeota archaeon]